LLLPNLGLILLRGTVLCPCTQIPREPFECFGSNLDHMDWMDWQIEVNDMSAAAVARSLNARGITGKRGGRWQGQSMKRTISHTFHANRVDFTFPSKWRTMPWHRK
jgi:hypothetical protein